MKKVIIYYSPYVPIVGLVVVIISLMSDKSFKLCIDEGLDEFNIVTFIQAVSLALLMLTPIVLLKN